MQHHPAELKLYKILKSYEKVTKNASTISPPHKPNMGKLNSVKVKKSSKEIMQMRYLVRQVENYFLQLHKTMQKYQLSEKNLLKKCNRLCDEFILLAHDFQENLDRPISLSLIKKTQLLLTRLESCLYIKNSINGISRNNIKIRHTLKNIQQIFRKVRNGKIIQTQILYQQCGICLHLFFSTGGSDFFTNIGVFLEKETQSISKKLKKLQTKIIKIKQNHYSQTKE
ncbi:MAG: hypothetical protein ACRCVN_05140 [Spirochaetia bacterium]